MAKIGGELVQAKTGTPEAILEVARDADAILTTYAKVTTEVVQALTKCKIIARFGIGVDNVDIDMATKKGIVVTKVPDYCIDEVSDHAMALLLSIVRKIPYSNKLVQAGDWRMPAVVPIARLRGRTLGLVGFGRIPQLVAPKAQAFGINVITYDPFVPKDVLAKANVKHVGTRGTPQDVGLRFAALPADARNQAHHERQNVRHDEARLLYRQHRSWTSDRRGGAWL